MKKVKQNIVSYFILILLIGFNPFEVFGQEVTGSLKGIVKDQKSEQPIPGVLVALEGTSYGTLTDDEGKFVINNIIPGAYNARISCFSYQEKTEYNVVVRSAGTPDLNIFLVSTATELEEVVITANPFIKEDETPLSIQKLSREEVATYPGGNNDIAKVVQSLPGVSGSIGGFRNDVIIRGGAPNENVYYLDDVEIPNINHFSTQGSAGGPVGLLNVSFFDGVSVSSSSFGAQYDNALSGVLQFNQRSGNNQNFLSNFRLGASEAALTFEGPLFKKEKDEAKTTFIVSARRSYLQFLFELIDLPFLPDYWDFQYKLDHRIDDYNEIKITGLGSIDDFKINVPDSYDESQQAILDQVPVIQQWSKTSGVTWKRRFKDGSGFLNSTLSTNVLNNKFVQYSDNVSQTGEVLVNDSQEWEKKLRLRLVKYKGEWSFRTGLVAQHVTYSNATTDIANNFNYDGNLQFWKFGVFGNTSRNFLKDRLGVTAGFRTDVNTCTTTGGNPLNTISPRVSFRYTLDSAAKWSMTASVGRYFKLPPYTILGFRDSSNAFINQNSAYTRSDHYVLGVERLVSKSARISVEAFFKQYANYPVSGVDSVSVANLGGGFEVLGNEPVSTIGLGRSYGVEVLFQQKFSGKVYGILAYTFYKSEYTGFDVDNYLPSVWDSRHLVTFTGGIKMKKNWEFNTRFLFAAQTPFAPVDVAASLPVYPVLIRDYNSIAGTNLGSLNRLDFRVDKKWNFKKWTLDVFIDIQNILNTSIPSEPQYGLLRDASGNVIVPNQLVEIPAAENNTVLPTIGLVIDL